MLILLLLVLLLLSVVALVAVCVFSFEIIFFAAAFGFLEGIEIFGMIFDLLSSLGALLGDSIVFNIFDFIDFLFDIFNVAIDPSTSNVFTTVGLRILGLFGLTSPVLNDFSSVLNDVMDPIVIAQFFQNLSAKLKSYVDYLNNLWSNIWN